MMRTRHLLLSLATSVALTPSVWAQPTETPAAPDAEVGLFDATSGEPEVESRENIEVGAMGEISIEAANVDITTVLRGLSMQAGRNIIISRNVTGEVTFTIRDAQFYDALEAILSANGFRYLEKGGFIHVMTEDEFEKLENANRKVETRLVRLNYLNAEDAKTFVEPMLSEAGTIVATGRVGEEISDTENLGDNSFSDTPTVLVRDYEEELDEITATLAALDRQPQMVLIEATILQATLNDTNSLGVDFSIFFNIDGLDLANPLTVVDQLISGSASDSNSQAAISSPVGGTDQAGGAKIGITSNDVSFFVRALNQITNTNVVSNPKLTVLNRQRADILVGQQLGYLQTTQTETSVTQTVEFLDVGTQLSVRPFVSEDGFIRLELKPSVSDGETTVQAGFVIPDTVVAELTTNVILKSGQTVVLGGLFTEDTDIDRDQVPFLGDIPYAGNAFRGKDTAVSRTEVIFLVKATVMENKALAEMGDSAGDNIQRSRVAIRSGLLPWSRDKLAVAHLRDAVEAMESGNKDKAAWSANLALHLDPSMTEALQIKQRVTGEKVFFQEHSLMSNVLDETINKQLEDLGIELELEPAIEVPEAGTQPAAEGDITPDAGISPVNDEADAETPVPGFVETEETGEPTPAEASAVETQAEPIDATETAQTEEALDPAGYSIQADQPELDDAVPALTQTTTEQADELFEAEDTLMAREPLFGEAETEAEANIETPSAIDLAIQQEIAQLEAQAQQEQAQAGEATTEKAAEELTEAEASEVETAEVAVAEEAITEPAQTNFVELMVQAAEAREAQADALEAQAISLQPVEAGEPEAGIELADVEAELASSDDAEPSTEQVLSDMKSWQDGDVDVLDLGTMDLLSRVKEAAEATAEEAEAAQHELAAIEETTDETATADATEPEGEDTPVEAIATVETDE